MQQLLTGKRRFPGFEGEWRKLTLGDLVQIVYGKSPKEVIDDDGKFPIIGTGGVTGYAIKPLHSEPCVIIGRKGTIDQPQYIEKPCWPIDTTFYCIPKATCNVRWIFFIVSELNLRRYNEASGVPSLSRKSLYSIRINTPTVDEQTIISDLLNHANLKAGNIESQCMSFKEQKKALMQQLLTGKRRVRMDRDEV